MSSSATAVSSLDAEEWDEDPDDLLFEDPTEDFDDAVLAESQYDATQDFSEPETLLPHLENTIPVLPIQSPPTPNYEFPSIGVRTHFDDDASVNYDDVQSAGAHSIPTVKRRRIYRKQCFGLEAPADQNQQRAKKSMLVINALLLAEEDFNWCTVEVKFLAHSIL